MYSKYLCIIVENLILIALMALIIVILTQILIFCIYKKAKGSQIVHFHFMVNREQEN